MTGANILICLSGSIAVVKIPALVSELVKAGANVRCVATKSATKLVSPLSLSTLCRNKCFLDKDQWSHGQTKPLHIELAEWADVIVAAPLSASSLARWSVGLGEGLFASVLLASECPVIAAAAMNTAMWNNGAIKKNWEALADNPKTITLDPVDGLLACDSEGKGLMANNEVIVLAIQSALLTRQKNGQIKKDFNNERVLVTAGGTLEALDPARQISNKSSGRTGVFIAQAARLRGAKVDLIHGSLDVPDELLEGLTTHSGLNSLEMREKLCLLQPSSTLIFMAAAVSDLRRIGGETTQKIRKENLIHSISQNLELVPDLLQEMCSKRVKNQTIVGFAAVTGDKKQLKDSGQQKLTSKRCDFIFANPIDVESQGFGNCPNGGFLIGAKNFEKEFEPMPKFLLANKILDQLMANKTKNIL